MKKNVPWIILVVLLLLLLLFAYCRPAPKVAQNVIEEKELYAAASPPAPECPPTPASVVTPVLDIPRPKAIAKPKRKAKKMPEAPQPLLVVAPPPRVEVVTTEAPPTTTLPIAEPTPNVAAAPLPEPLPEVVPPPVLLPPEEPRERPRRMDYFPQLGIRAGGNMPGWGIFVDLNALPYTSFDTPLYTRFSLGIVQEGSAAAAVMHVNEIAVLSRNESTTLYAGLGLNVPLSSNSKLGYDLMIGVEKTVKMFGLRNEAVYIETGVTTFSGGAIDDKTTTMLSAGYKFSL